jgi:hypothetical protein
MTSCQGQVFAEKRFLVCDIIFGLIRHTKVEQAPEPAAKVALSGIPVVVCLQNKWLSPEECNTDWAVAQ